MREMITEATRTIEDAQTAQALHGLLSLKSDMTGPSTFPALLKAVGEQISTEASTSVSHVMVTENADMPSVGMTTEIKTEQQNEGEGPRSVWNSSPVVVQAVPQAVQAGSSSGKAASVMELIMQMQQSNKTTTRPSILSTSGREKVTVMPAAATAVSKVGNQSQLFTISPSSSSSTASPTLLSVPQLKPTQAQALTRLIQAQMNATPVQCIPSQLVTTEPPQAAAGQAFSIPQSVLLQAAKIPASSSATQSSQSKSGSASKPIQLTVGGDNLTNFKVVMPQASAKQTVTVASSPVQKSPTPLIIRDTSKQGNLNPKKRIIAVETASVGKGGEVTAAKKQRAGSGSNVQYVTIPADLSVSPQRLITVSSGGEITPKTIALQNLVMSPGTTSSPVTPILLPTQAVSSNAPVTQHLMVTLPDGKTVLVQAPVAMTPASGSQEVEVEVTTEAVAENLVIPENSDNDKNGDNNPLEKDPEKTGPVTLPETVCDGFWSIYQRIAAEREAMLNRSLNGDSVQVKAFLLITENKSTS